MCTLLGSLSAFAQLNNQVVLQSLNDLRDEGCNCGNEVMRPASQLIWDEELANIAQDYANQLYEANKDQQHHIFLSHVGIDASTLEDRLQDNAYYAKACVENIAYLPGNFDMVIDHWLNNPLSCKNLLNRSMTVAGIAQKGDYWVVLLAIPQKLIH